MNTSPVWTAPPFPNTSVSSSSNHCNAPCSVDVPPSSIRLKNGDVLSKTLSEKYMKEAPRGKLINCDGALSPALSTSSVTFSPERTKQLSNGPVLSDHSSKCCTSTLQTLTNDVSSQHEKYNCVLDTSRVTYSQASVTSSTVVETQPKLTNHVGEPECNGSTPVIPSTPQPQVNGLSPNNTVSSCGAVQEEVVDQKSPVKKEVSLSVIPCRDLPPLLIPAGIPEGLPARDVITMCRYVRASI